MLISSGLNITELKKHREAGDLLLSYLEQINVEYVFGIPGGAIEPLYNALARSSSRNSVKAVIARHETGAAFMAEGYARNSGKLGVCCSTTGPGATNLITGVSSAYENQIPMLVITAQTALKHFGRKAFQDSADTGINIVGMFQFCTRYNTMVTHPDQLEQKLITAIMTALTPPFGPAHLSIPVDILKSSEVNLTPQFNLSHLLQKPSLLDSNAIQLLWEDLRKARNPVFVLGAGCREASPYIQELANFFQAPLLTTPDGKGLVSPYHPLYRGVIGFAGHRTAIDLLSNPEVDMIITVGTLLSEWSSNGWDANTLMNERLVHVDDVETNIRYTPMARMHVRGNISTVFEVLVDKAIKIGAFDQVTDEPADTEKEAAASPSAPTEQRLHFDVIDKQRLTDESSPIRPQWLMHTLGQLFPSHTKYLADTGNSVAWAIHYLMPFDRRLGERRGLKRINAGRRTAPGATFQCALEFASMGWAIGNAVGAALANPTEPIVCITGDGSVLMSGQEVTVAKQLGLHIVFIILNDSQLGMVKHGQDIGKAESIGHELPDVNFADMAKAMGIEAYRIETARDLTRLDARELCKSDGPTVLDVVIDPRQVPPIDVRIKTLQQVNEQ